MATGSMFELYATIGIDASGFEEGIDSATSSMNEFEESLSGDLESGIRESESSLDELGDTLGEKLPEETEKAKNAISTFSEILKADFVKGAIGAAIDGIKTLASAISGLVTNSVDAYASYEQLVGGVETLFGEEGLQKVLENADNAWKTAGVSVNDYMELVMNVGSAVMNDLRDQMGALTEEEVEQRVAALDAELEAVTKELNAELTAKKRAHTQSYNELKKSLDREYDARKQYFDDVYSALEESLSNEINAAKKANEQRLESAEKAYEKDVEAYEKATEARISAIDKEYLESIKLIDEEKYRRLKAIDDQIDALNDQTEAERKALEAKERKEKKSSLLTAIEEAKTFEDRQKAYAALLAFNRSNAQKDREEERQEQIEALKNEKESIKDEADAKKAAAKEQRDNTVEAIKEERSETLKAMKEAYNAEIDALKEAQEAQIEELNRSKKAQLTALKRAQSEELAAIKEANSEQLSSLKETQAEELSTLKDANTKKLEETKKYVKEQKEALAEGSKIQLTDEQEIEVALKAVKILDQAIRDISDISNKMGTDFDSTASGVFATSRGIFQMFDNLHIGYGGTRAEVERMLKDAEAYEAAQGNMVNLEASKFTDILTGLSAVVEKLGIAETTKNEAEGTISGSLGALKASWENLVLGFAQGDADLQTLLDTFIQNVETALNNLIPVIERILDALGTFVEDIAPVIEEKLPPLLEKLTPIITTALNTLADAVGPTLPGIAKTILSSFHNAMTEEFPIATPLLEVGFVGFIGGSIIKAVGGIKDLIGPALTGLMGFIKGGLGVAPEAAEAAASASGAIGTAAAGAVAVAVGAYDVTELVNASNTYKTAQETHASEIESAFENYKKIYADLGKEAADEWANACYQIDTTGSDLEDVQTKLKEKIDTLWDDTPENMWDGFKQGWDHYFGDEGTGGGLTGLMTDAMDGFVGTALDFLGIASPSKVFAEMGDNTLAGFEQGFADRMPRILDLVRRGAIAIADTFKVALGINSPSKVFENFGRMVPAGFEEGVEKALPGVAEAMDDMLGMVTSGFQTSAISAPKMWEANPSSEGRDMTVVLQLDQFELGRVVYRLYNEENQKAGIVLA